MKVLFADEGWEDYRHSVASDQSADRLNRLIEECRRTPFTGLGKPEPLKQRWKGWWSRRIDGEHRIVYRVSGKGEEQVLEIAQCRFHY